MDCDTLSSSVEETIGCEKISINDQIRRLQHLSSKSESFIVDMERFSHPTTAKDETTPNSRITLQRNLSRKGSQKKNSNIENEANTDILSPASSPRGASLLGTTISTPEKVALVAVGSTINSQLHHHQITVSAATPTAQTKLAANKFNSFKRSSPCRPVIDPRRILFIFATLSSMGTILLIYFTLCMAKLSGDETAAIS